MEKVYSNKKAKQSGSSQLQPEHLNLDFQDIKYDKIAFKNKWKIFSNYLHVGIQSQLYFI